MANHQAVHDSYMKEVMHWLNKRYKATDEFGRYFSHEPIYGYRDGPSEPDKLSRLSRAYQILQILNRLEFDSCVDVGGAEGYWGNVLRRLFGVPCLSCDLSYRANLVAKVLYGLHGITLEMTQMPIRDGVFDLVLCSETLEHVVDPVMAVRELVRVSRKYVLITTPLARSTTEQEMYLRLAERDHQPHRHLHYFTKRDLIELLGEGTTVRGLRSIAIHPLLLQLDKISSTRFPSDDFIEFVLRLDSAFSKKLPWFCRDILIVKNLGSQPVHNLLRNRAKIDIRNVLRFLVRENRLRPERVAEMLGKEDATRTLIEEDS